MGAKTEAIVNAFAPTAASIGIIDAAGNIDLDVLEKLGNAAFEKQPKVTLWKLTFSKEDFADFIQHLRGSK